MLTLFLPFPFSHMQGLSETVQQQLSTWQCDTPCRVTLCLSLRHTTHHSSAHTHNTQQHHPAAVLAAVHQLTHDSRFLQPGSTIHLAPAPADHDDRATYRALFAAAAGAAAAAARVRVEAPAVELIEEDILRDLVQAVVTQNINSATVAQKSVTGGQESVTSVTEGPDYTFEGLQGPAVARQDGGHQDTASTYHTPGMRPLCVCLRGPWFIHPRCSLVQSLLCGVDRCVRLQGRDWSLIGLMLHMPDTPTPPHEFDTHVSDTCEAHTDSHSGMCDTCGGNGGVCVWGGGGWKVILDGVENLSLAGEDEVG